jgi:arylsulfatase A-like enzyme
VYVPHPQPHVPLYVSDKFAVKSEQGIYGDVIMEIDWSIGQVLETLRELELDQNTLVIVTSDNGPWLTYGKHAGSAEPLREGKGTSFEGGVRVPTLFWWPGKIPAGTTCDQLVATIDVLPTIAHLIDAPLPERKIDGHDIRPLMFGEPGAVSPHVAYPIYFNARLESIRDNRWKVVFPHTYRSFIGREIRNDGRQSGYTQVPLESAVLFDLVNDVSETTDVSERYPEVFARLKAAADEFRAELGDGRAEGPGVRPHGRVGQDGTLE